MKSTIVCGDTAIYGVLAGITFDPPQAAIEMLDGKAVVAAMADPVARGLIESGRLGTTIGLRGTATWNVETWEILAFEAADLLPYDPDAMGLDRAFGELAKASGGRWDGVGAADYVGSLRRD